MIDQVLSNVRRYLQQTESSVWTAQPTSAQFYWNQDLPLYELEVRAADGRQGYLLVSNSQELPFVISRSVTGGLLSSKLRRRLAEIASAASIQTGMEEVRFQYVVPFSFIAHFPDGTAVQLDDGAVVTGLRGEVEQSAPQGTLVVDGIADEWNTLATGARNLSVVTEIMHDSGPYYNQAYNGSCVISGCTAVAWACYAAWLKGTGGLLPTLFSSSDCWYNDWGSYWHCQQPVDECKDADSLIWWFNKVLLTVNGATTPANVIRGSAVLAQYGSPQVVMRAASPDTATIAGLMKNYAILLCGVRDWQFLIDAPDKRATKYDAPAGHCVVAHGMRESEVYVNMGWGAYTKSVWFNLNSISQRQTYGLYTR